jgi:4-hydroxy-tetrahydrodipicolinate synthase
MVPIPLDLVEKLLDRFPETLAGVKDSSGDWASMQSFLQFAEKGFDVFSGSEEFLLPLLQAGGAGTISAAANVIPGILQTLYQGWKQPGSEQRQTAVKKISSVLRSKPLIPSLKAILAKTRRDARWKECRPPLVALNLKEEEDLFEALDETQFDWHTLGPGLA